MYMEIDKSSKTYHSANISLLFERNDAVLNSKIPACFHWLAKYLHCVHGYHLQYNAETRKRSWGQNKRLRWPTNE